MGQRSVALPPELASDALLAAPAGVALAERITSGGSTAGDDRWMLAAAGVAPLPAVLTLLVHGLQVAAINPELNRCRS